MNIAFIVGLLLMLAGGTHAQVATSSALYATLKANDSLLFDIGFNTCDIAQFEKLLSEHFEMYHDEAGPILSKSAFISSVRDGLCKLPYHPRRELVEGSLEVYPLEKNGEIYGAVQMGRHKFFAKEANKPEYLTSEARFTHLWLLENGSWKLSRVLSFDHVQPKQNERQLRSGQLPAKPYR